MATVRIEDDLYDKVMESRSNPHDTISDVTEKALRFWLSVTSRDGSEEVRTAITDEEEALVNTFLRFIRRASSNKVAAVSHIIEDWRIEQRTPMR